MLLGMLLFLAGFIFFGRQILLAVLTVGGHVVIFFASLFGANEEIPKEEAQKIVTGKVLTYFQQKNKRCEEISPYLTLLGKTFLETGNAKNDKELFHLVNQLEKRRFIQIASAAVYYLDAKPLNWNGEVAFLLGGAWNDPEGIMPIIWDYYIAGYQVISVSYPDAKAALVTTHFLKRSIRQWHDVDAHVFFIDQCLGQLIDSDQPFRLCGYSTGGNVMAGLLHFWLADRFGHRRFANLREVRIISPACTRGRQLPQFVGDLFRNVKHLKKMPTEWEGIVNAYTNKGTCGFGWYWRLIKVFVTATQSIKAAFCGSTYWDSIVDQCLHGQELPPHVKILVQYDPFDQVVAPEHVMRHWVCDVEQFVTKNVKLEYFNDRIGHGAILYDCAKRALKK
jgi:hypothetical protein